MPDVQALREGVLYSFRALAVSNETIRGVRSQAVALYPGVLIMNVAM